MLWKLFCMFSIWVHMFNNKETGREYGKCISQVMPMLQSISVSFVYNYVGMIMTRNHWKRRSKVPRTLLWPTRSVHNAILVVKKQNVFTKLSKIREWTALCKNRLIVQHQTSSHYQDCLDNGKEQMALHEFEITFLMLLCKRTCLSPDCRN